jgi:hypothetical protein
MTDSLRAEVVPPRRKSGWLFLLVPLMAQLAVMATCRRTERTTVFVPPVLPTRADAPKRAISSELFLVFRDNDQTYMKVDHENQVRIGEKVYVDNDCIATVTGLETVYRLASDAEEYDKTTGAEVLAAKLDRCDGTYARSADLPMVVVPETRPDDAELVKKAKRALLQSDAAADVERVWREEYPSLDDWKTQAMYDIRTLHHPLTGQTWISIHAWNEAGCGEASINIWGLFRVEQDGSITIKQMRDLGDMRKIDQIIDIDGDGTLELIGTPWLGLDVILTRATGDELERLPLPYDGCPC